MKIVLLPSTVYTDPTYYRVLTGLKREFASSGHKALIVSLKTDTSGCLQIKPETKAVYLARSSSVHGRNGQNLLIRSLAKQLSPGTILNFHFSGWLRPWHAPVLLSKHIAAASLVITFQDYRHPDLPPLTSAMHKSMQRILNKAHCVTTVSHFLADMIRQDFPSAAAKLFIIPNGADIPGKTRSSRRAQKRKYILTIGRAAPYKGLDLLLFAFARAVGESRELDLVVCGTDGKGYLANLAQKLGIDNNVIFKGIVSHMEISTLMKDCLFYTTTPRWESFGMGALEAMAAGKAVLATKTGGLLEFARNNRNSLLVNSADIESISSGIRQLCTEGELREAMGNKALATSLKYSWARITGEYALVYATQDNTSSAPNSVAVR